jgi:hypothetical protein
VTISKRSRTLESFTKGVNGKTLIDEMYPARINNGVNMNSFDLVNFSLRTIRKMEGMKVTKGCRSCHLITK